MIYDQVKGEGGEHFAMNDNVSYSAVAVLNTHYLIARKFSA